MRRTLCRGVRGARQSLPPAAREQATVAAFLPKVREYLPASQKADARLHGSADGRYRSASTDPSWPRDRTTGARKKPSSRQAVPAKLVANRFQENAFASSAIHLAANQCEANQYKKNEPIRVSSRNSRLDWFYRCAGASFVPAFKSTSRMLAGPAGTITLRVIS